MGGHPILYVGRGSHALWFKKGERSIAGSCFAPKELNVLGLSDQAASRLSKQRYMIPVPNLTFGNQVGVSQQIYTNATKPWAAYQGAWGQLTAVGALNSGLLINHGLGPGGLVGRAAWEPATILVRIRNIVENGSPA